MELVNNPLFARYWNWRGARLEEHGGREIRGELLAGLSGRVAEVGAGAGPGVTAGAATAGPAGTG